MNCKFLSILTLICTSAIASGPSLIVCEPKDKSDQNATGIWPRPYLEEDKLCFDIRVDEGKACVGNARTTKWLSGAIIVNIDGKPQGRDDTWLRVVNPTISDKKIEYKIEGSRDDKHWGLVSDVSINRLSGEAVDWFIGEHGGTSYQCHLEGRKI